MSAPAVETTMPVLKKDVQSFLAIAVCRSCFVSHGMKVKPHMTFISSRMCSVSKCENESTFIIVDAQ